MKKITLLFLTSLLAFSAAAQFSPVNKNIPMRDGKFLAADFYSDDSTSAKPTILIQTPYGKFFYALNGLPWGVNKDLTDFPYNVVIVDWRGRFASLPAFTIGSDNGEDGYDVVEWIAAQSWSDGKIGTWGPSALGNVQFSTAMKRPPHLTCCVPEVAAPQLDYHNYYGNGSINLERFQSLNTLFPGSYDLVIQYPHYNIIWESIENGSMDYDSIEVPMLLMAGWFDHNIQQDMQMIDTLVSSSNSSVQDKHKIMIGPWVHGGTGQASLGTEFQGDLSFPNAEKANDSLSLRFFDYYLRGINNGFENQPRYTYFDMGKRIWKSADAWPIPSVTSKNYYLHDDFSISTTVPTLTEVKSYLYDPTDPSPTVGGKTLSTGIDQGPYDQAPQVESRSDNATWTTEAFSEDVSVKGRIKVHLNVSSDRLDTDFMVRLTEVYPNGKSIMLSGNMQRMRFREGFRIADTVMMSPGTVYPITIVLDDISNTFKAGNKMRLIVSSSNYPRYNRNMNTGGEMYPDNNIDTLVSPVTATNSIHLGPTTLSRVELPVDTLGSASSNQPTLESLITVYPNPTNGILHVKGISKKTRIKVYNQQGQVILMQIGNSLDLTDFSTGVYILHLEDSELNSRLKVLVH